MRKQGRMKKLHIALALILIVLVGILLIQGIKAKYTTSVNVNGNVTFSANLAKSLSLYEHKANRLSDGSYALSENEIVGTAIDPDTDEPITVKGNEYMVMPGVDIPKDPQIEIIGKSAIDSYLYIEIADSLLQSNVKDNGNVKYELSKSWLKLDDVSGPNGNAMKPTSVYVYTGEVGESGCGTMPKVLDENFTPSTETSKIIKIIDKDIVTVGEEYASTAFSMNIYAHLLQIPQSLINDPDITVAEQVKQVFTSQLQPSKAPLMMFAANKKNVVTEDEGDENAGEASVVVSAASDEDPEYVTVTIRYVDAETGISVFDDYVATLRYGTEFSMDVDSPTRVGYTPYLGDEVANTVVIEKKEYTENVVFTVEYRPALVSYVVRHYVQNASDDSYSEYKMVTGKLLTGSKPTTAELSIAELTNGGFESLYHEPDTVAADGSTEFHVYYDRKYFLYTFDCNGGYGVDPVYVRYETPLAVPTPVKPGYKFVGWQKQDASGDWVDVEVDTTVGLSDVSYRAKWEALPTGSSYTAIYWLESPEPDVAGQPKKYEYWGSEIVRNVQAGNKVDGSDDAGEKRPNGQPGLKLPDYEYAVFNADETDKLVEIKGDGSTVVNVYYTRKTYNLKFYYAKEENGKYYVCGNTTNFAEGSGITNQLSNVHGNWEDVESLPIMTPTESIDVSIYETGYDEYKVSNTNGKYYYILLSGKYDMDISEKWPVGIFLSAKLKEPGQFGDYAYFSAWNVDSGSEYDSENSNKTLKGNYQRLDSKMLIKDNSDRNTIHFLGFWENATWNVTWNKAHRWTYKNYVPILEDETPEHTYNGVEYKLHSSFVLYDNNDTGNPQEQTATAIDGFENTARKAIDNGVIDSNYNLHSYTMNFYYTRNRHKLQMMNYDEIISTVENVGAWEPLGKYNVAAPSVPQNLEKGAYEFDGWYTSPECADGTEVNWSEIKMPDNDLMLYAKWTPIQRKITFSNHYLDAQKKVYLAGFGGTISHGQNMVEQNIPIPSIDPKDGDISADGIGNATKYTPVGWFYVDPTSGEKKKYEPGAMKVTGDLHLFMEWRSNQVVGYTVEYYKDNEDGTYTQIADSITGYSFSGLTRTFKAKIADELYPDFQTKHYPMESSHSILMTETGANTFRFLYRHKDNVSYKINYIDQLTKLDMIFTNLPRNPEIEYSGTTSEAVITKKFVSETGYMPDAFYKRLILSYPDDKNIITFYYTKDNEHAYYAVKHMIETVDGSYQEYAYTQGVGDIGKLVTANALNLGGYEYDQNKTREMIPETQYQANNDGVSGWVTLNGLEMTIYYKRAESGYKVRYVEYGTDISDESKDLKQSEIKQGKYGDFFTIEPPKSIVGKDKVTNEEITYLLQGDDTYTSTMGILNYENGDKGKPIYPQIIFYYTVKRVQISYEGVCKTVEKDFGTLSILNERAATASALGGCTATPTKGFRFVGWYSDKTCENLVSPEFHYKPATLPNENTTYYALFEPILSELVIEKEGTNISDKDTFLFEVKGISGGATGNIDLTVTITGEGSITISNLPIGNYTVAELTDWSWRYNGVSDPIEISISENKEGHTNMVTFTNAANSSTWLGGESMKENLFDAYVPPAGN